jgi:hypothetical protein
MLYISFAKQKTCFCKTNHISQCHFPVLFLSDFGFFSYFCTVNSSLNERNTGASTKSMFEYTFARVGIVL